MKPDYNWTYSTEKKFEVGFIWKKFRNNFHSEKSSKFTNICQVKA